MTIVVVAWILVRILVVLCGCSKVGSNSFQKCRIKMQSFISIVHPVQSNILCFECSVVIVESKVDLWPFGYKSVISGIYRIARIGRRWQAVFEGFSSVGQNIFTYVTQLQ